MLMTATRIDEDDVQSFVAAVKHYLMYTLGRQPAQASTHELYHALSLAVRQVSICLLYTSDAADE